MTHPLYNQVATTVGMRRLAAAAVHRVVCDAFPRLELVTRLEDGRVVVDARLPLWAWLGLGLVHLRRWWQVRRVARQELALVKSDVRLKVQVVRWQQRKTVRQWQPIGGQSRLRTSRRR